jgi:anti-anti-sigma factor
MSSSGPFAITSEDRDGVDVIRLEGEFDLTNADDVRKAVVATTTAGVVLDVTAVSYLDSSGIRAIDRGHRDLAAEQRSLFIVSPPDTPSSWTFRVAGFSGDVVVETLDEALAAAVRRHRPA